MYNKELGILRDPKLFAAPEAEDDVEGLGPPTPYEYADVWPPLGVARRLFQQYTAFIRELLKDNRQECQLADESLQGTLSNCEVPSYVVSRRIISERAHRKKLGAQARLIGVCMDLWNGRLPKAVDRKLLTNTYVAVTELDFDE